MAAAFTLAWLFVLGGGAISVLLYQGERSDSRRIVNRYLPLVVIFAVLLTYLVAKLFYEELIPCWTVDEYYCDYGSTQYRNLFGWEF